MIASEHEMAFITEHGDRLQTMCQTMDVVARASEQLEVQGESLDELHIVRGAITTVLFAEQYRRKTGRDLSQAEALTSVRTVNGVALGEAHQDIRAAGLAAGIQIWSADEQPFPYPIENDQIDKLFTHATYRRAFFHNQDGNDPRGVSLTYVLLNGVPRFETFETFDINMVDQEAYRHVYIGRAASSEMVRVGLVTQPVYDELQARYKATSRGMTDDLPEIFSGYFDSEEDLDKRLAEVYSQLKPHVDANRLDPLFADLRARAIDAHLDRELEGIVGGPLPDTKLLDELQDLLDARLIRQRAP